MNIANNLLKTFALSALAVMTLIGCGRGGATIKANPQTISFAAAPVLLLHGSAAVSASASSGLAVSYNSATPAICTVDAASGLVAALAAGICSIAADQSGNNEFAPATQSTLNLPVVINPIQSISFAAAPTLTVFGTATVTAMATSNLAVSYSSTTPTVCSVNASTGLVTNIVAGDCIVAANQAGDAFYNIAPQVTQTLTVSAWAGPITAPGAPTGVTATTGNTPNTVTVSFIAPSSSGGSLVTGYNVISNPAGISATGVTSPITASCPPPCTGYSFSVVATNIAGSGAASAQADVLTNYNVHVTIREPDTQPRDSIFIGSFTFNSTVGTVSDLHGILSESMTGDLIAYPNDTMTWLTLNNQLSSVYDATLGGLLVTTFLLPTTHTFSANPALGGSDGWAPGSGKGLYYGYPGANPGNAYATIFVNLADPSAAPTFAQIQALAYADCAAGGMMGSTCMTGYGGVGSMGGYPIAQTITKQ